ncbi:MAG: efflux RND transporter periplasmic adaptor subunit [Deltaproteobacteria bacterium]|nr:efflux RND transporter periplasmic adaptor subunit [Deltaproteobacteria bacterium]
MQARAFLVLIAPLLWFGCGKGGGASQPLKQTGPTAFPVEVESVTSRQVDYVAQAVGTIEAFETVQVTSRVAGVVERVRFQEGDVASVNQVLVEIEPRRFRLALAAQEAALLKAKAAREDAMAGLGRRQAAIDKTPGLIPGEEVATWKTRVATADAEVAAAEAALSSADLNLRDAFVRAPVQGMIETRSVQTGQYVQPGTILATLVRRDPLLLRFQLPTDAAMSLRKGDEVQFKLGDTQAIHNAKIIHIAQAADPATRQVPVAARVEDQSAPDLRPGSFARVTARLDVHKDSKTKGDAAPLANTRPAIPESAIRPSEHGFVAFVVKDGKAEERHLTLGLRTSDGRVEVVSGIAAGEALVVRGAEALRDGSLVKIAATRAVSKGS